MKDMLVALKLSHHKIMCVISATVSKPIHLNQLTGNLNNKQVLQVVFLFAVGGREDCHNPCNVK